ncbi:MAG: RIP metalloprotease RseP [Rhodobacteraceae bacterium]|nr:MAG: RIP metalloprotease RseP [Paracoccaceae bacterium]
MIKLILGTPIFLAIIAFVAVIFIHELGHYLMGRLCGIGASTFSIGFGPKLISYTDRRNTEWTLCLIPLGGFVKFWTKSDDPSPNNKINYRNETSSTGSFSQKSFEASTLLARTLTVLAGPFANFLMSVVIFTGVALSNGIISPDPIVGKVAALPGDRKSILAGDKILSIQGQSIDRFEQIYEITSEMDRSSSINFRVLRDGKTLDLIVPYLFQPVVFSVEMFSPAMKAGIETGDVFLEANSRLVSSFEDIKAIINSSKGNPVLVTVWRNGQIFKKIISPEMRPTETPTGNIVEKMRIGVRGGSLLSPAMVTPSIYEAGLMGINMTIYVVRTSLVGLARMIDRTISSKHLSGPVGVAKALSYSASEGSIPFLSLLAAISAGIGLINLFPIPILDGGHLMMFLYESIFKAPPPNYVVKFLMSVGFFVLFALMVFATFNDIVR